MNRFLQIFDSWQSLDNEFNSIDDIINWIIELNNIVKVNVIISNFNYNDDWYFDKNEDVIKNRNNSFFTIKGIKKCDSNNNLLSNQIIIDQPEIGYLGILAKEFNGKLYFLMQAKIEPGNINKVQISPTLQATRSNFMLTHGGKAPQYLDYFIDSNKYEVIIDQIQSEQSSRFYRKRNRNIIIIVSDEIVLDKWHKWMTLGQIKELMKYDNLVNMDTRTVISCIPFSLRRFNDFEKETLKSKFTSISFYNSFFDDKDCGNDISKIYHYINNKKMFDFNVTQLIGLSQLKGWKFIDSQFVSDEFDYKMVYCDIEIEGREVKHWKQPLFASICQQIFGLFCANIDGKLKFLVNIRNEIGSFDKFEIGPTVQSSINNIMYDNDVVVKLFYQKYLLNQGIKFKGIFSEEGGRFYHEQNINLIIQIGENELADMPKGYFWLDYYTLNLFIQFNNCLNIQLRNLLSILNL